MLIAALEVDVRGPAEFLAERQHRLVTRAGVEPDIQDVALAFELASTATRAREVSRDELGGRPFVPRVGAVLLEAGCGLFDERRRQQCFTALRAVHGRNRNAPRPLT